MQELINELKYQKFLVLDDGFVCLVDIMGSDAAIAQAARVSYGEGTKSVSDDRTLIRYLMRKYHSSPFEMAELKFHIRVPLYIWQQWLRHRTASINQQSHRYSVIDGAMQRTKPDAWRLQNKNNKQGSDGFLPLEPDANTGGKPQYQPNGTEISNKELESQQYSKAIYEQRIKAGIAREQARKDLPLSTYTEAYWKIDLHNLLHFLSLRMAPDAQQEIRDYASTIGNEIVSRLFPATWEAFCDYRTGSVTLTRLEVYMLETMVDGREDGFEPANSPEEYFEFWAIESGLTNKRERNECREKLERLGLL